MLGIGVGTPAASAHGDAVHIAETLGLGIDDPNVIAQFIQRFRCVAFGQKLFGVGHIGTG